MNDTNTSAMENDFEFRGETVFRFEGKDLLNYSNPIKLKEEIDNHINLNEPKIDKAFINSKKKQLYIITSDLQTTLHLEKHTWNNKAFGSGINAVKPKDKMFFIAVRGVPTSIDIKDEEMIYKIKSKYEPISEFYRIIKKSENKELNILKIKVTNEACANHILTHGLQIGYVNYKTEIWNKHSNHNFINNHRIIRCNRIHSKGGGVAIIIKNNLKFKIIKKSSTEQHEFIAIEIFDSMNKFTFLSTYIHPNSKTNFEFLAEFIAQKKLIITGDFNSLNSDWYCTNSNKRGNTLSALLNNNKICILNNDYPTFSKSRNILDLGLSSHDLANSINSFKVHTDFNASDHYPISFQIQTDISRTKIQIINLDCFKENIKNIQPINDKIETIEELEMNLDNFTEMIKKAIKTASTEKITQNQKIKLP
ncbi:unnamed protein product, partial [Brachionus calyciflorus]